jgi:hypothetical protein
MRWFICSLICWLVLLLVVDRQRIRNILPAGLIAMFAQLAIDTVAIRANLYKILEPGIPIFGSSLFFTMGIAFPMGVLFVQTTPYKASYQLINITAWALLLTLFEGLALRFGMLKHLRWQLLLSLEVNLLVMFMLTWYAEHIVFPLEKERSEA